uniref:Putative membrane protein At1g16860 n=1 Tax=Anthurium amnicola TaxID=1678845 RepID=A0A1D1Y1M4_9ARAE
MGSRSQSHHQLSSGMLVSGPPEQPKERAPAVASRAVPYTGGDVKKSGELGKMFDIPSSATPGGSGRSASHSGPLSRPPSGPLPPKKTSSGPLAPPNLPATGLITGGPTRRSGGQGSQQGDQTPRSKKKPDGYGPAVTALESGGDGYGFKVPKLAVWSCVVVLALGMVVGIFLLVAVKNPVILAAVGVLLVPVGLLVLWNWARKRRDLEGYLRRFPDTNLLRAKTGEFVKVTGVVTCGSIPLETSYQGVSRCVYVSTELHEYRGWSGKPANPHHKRLTWGLRHAERHVADFYISDNQGGARALVRAGNGAKVTPFVKPSLKVDITKKNKELSPGTLSWLADNSVSYDKQIMHIEEGFIKEASVISVLGILQSQDNVLMIVPPAEPISTGCQWTRCLIPIHIEGLVLIGDENPNDEVIIA